MKVTYYGHSCFAAQVANKTLLFDPFITGNELATSINVQQVPADYILISHGHADHLLVKAGSGEATFGVPDSAGVPAAIASTAVSISTGPPRPVPGRQCRQR